MVSYFLQAKCLDVRFTNEVDSSTTTRHLYSGDVRFGSQLGQTLSWQGFVFVSVSPSDFLTVAGKIPQPLSSPISPTSPNEITFDTNSTSVAAASLCKLRCSQLQRHGFSRFIHNWSTVPLDVTVAYKQSAVMLNAENSQMLELRQIVAWELECAMSINTNCRVTGFEIWESSEV
jgi:hypothetical protein